MGPDSSSSINLAYVKEMLYAVRCLKSNEDMILALAGQFKQLLKLSSKCEDHIFIKFSLPETSKMADALQISDCCSPFTV